MRGHDQRVALREPFVERRKIASHAMNIGKAVQVDHRRTGSRFDQGDLAPPHLDLPLTNVHAPVLRLGDLQRRYWPDSSQCGKNKAISGNTVRIAIAASIGTTKIMAPFDTWFMFTLGTTAF